MPAIQVNSTWHSHRRAVFEIGRSAEAPLRQEVSRLAKHIRAPGRGPGELARLVTIAARAPLARDPVIADGILWRRRLRISAHVVAAFGEFQKIGCGREIEGWFRDELAAEVKRLESRMRRHHAQ